MRAGSLLSRVQRVENVITPPGEIITVLMYECQSEAICKAQGLAALGRPRRGGDVLVLISQQGPCDRGPHTHDAQVIISRRKD